MSYALGVANYKTYARQEIVCFCVLSAKYSLLPKTVVILIERVSIDICGKSIQLRIRNRVNIIVLILREFLDEYDDVKVEAVDVATLDTPAKWNSVCSEAIWRNYDLMRHTPCCYSLTIYRRNSEYKQHISDTQMLTVGITRIEKVSAFSLVVWR